MLHNLSSYDAHLFVKNLSGSLIVAQLLRKNISDSLNGFMIIKMETINLNTNFGSLTVSRLWTEVLTNL